MELIIFVLFVLFVALVLALIATWTRGEHNVETGEPEQRILPVKLEVRHDCFYLFHCDTDAFLAQGKTAQDLVDHMSQRFRGSAIVIQEGDQTQINRLKTQINRLKQELLKQGNRATRPDEVANASTSID